MITMNKYYNSWGNKKIKIKVGDSFANDSEQIKFLVIGVYSDMIALLPIEITGNASVEFGKVEVTLVNLTELNDFFLKNSLTFKSSGRNLIELSKRFICNNCDDLNFTECDVCKGEGGIEKFRAWDTLQE